MADIGTDIARAAEMLQNGELVAIPTETVYGLAGNGLSAEAIAKIYSTKGRPGHNPLILHISGSEKVQLYASEFPPEARQLAGAFWPGPLTLVLPKLDIVPDAATGGLDTVALRVPAHPLTLSLLNLLPFPLAAPSANLSNQVSPVTPAHVEEQLGEKIGYILDGGRCDRGIESAIVSFASGKPELLRLGSLSREDIEQVIGPIEFKGKSGAVHAPGMMKKHYSPQTPLLLVDHWKEFSDFGEDRVGLLCLRTPSGGQSFEKIYALSEAGDLAEAAHNLYTALVEMDKMGLDVIVAEKMPERGLGNSVNDRLERAAG